MKLISAILVALALVFATPALADTSISDFWTRKPVQNYARNYARADQHAAVPGMIASAAARTGKAHFASTLIHIARIESGLRCSPGGNGGGLFQFVGGTRRSLGLSYRAAQSCSANIAAAMRYADRCIAMGARTSFQLSACWNSGSPFTARRHLERAYRVARI